MSFNVVVTKHLADDKNDKYIVTLEGNATFDHLACLVDTVITMTAKDEAILEILERGKIFKVELKL